MSAGKLKTQKKLEPFKLFAPKGSNREVFAIYNSVIGGVIKGFIHDHPNYKENNQLLNVSLLKRICVSLVAADVSNRIKEAMNSKIKYKMFLDDIRHIQNIYPLEKESNEWIIIRSYKDALKSCCLRGCPTFISFDHDLGTDLTGYDFAKWIVEQDLDNPGFIPNNFEFHVHSANPPGAENISRYLKQHIDFRNNK